MSKKDKSKKISLVVKNLTHITARFMALVGLHSRRPCYVKATQSLWVKF